MCAIFGAVFKEGFHRESANNILRRIADLSHERGRDGRGYVTIDGSRHTWYSRSVQRSLTWGHQAEFFADHTEGRAAVIGNLRAEPTTEYVANKRIEDQQPYQCGPWTVVHNGTIANDQELRTHKVDTKIDSAAIVELLDATPTSGMRPSLVADHFAACIKQLKGSYAILATHRDHPGYIFAACNYRPIWYARTRQGTFFASSRDYLEGGFDDVKMMQPYSVSTFTPDGKICIERQPDISTEPGRNGTRALVVCSGGLDSVVSARIAQLAGYDITLLHFNYGSRAEGPELAAIRAIRERLDVPLVVLPMGVYDKEDSPLLQSDSSIAGGEAGAEFAHEWVPARNLVMLALATAYAESKGYDFIVLGNNLEEAGAYPDNEPEFIHRFNDLLPFAVGDGKRVRILMPVGNMMKHEIVANGLDFDAPLDLTWSCYRAGELHCGTCGPCYMRRTAFKINHADEVIRYEGE